MHISMTFGDLLLSFFVGVIGSVAAAYLYKILPQATANISLWWAERSARSRAAKLKKLAAELQGYRAALAEPIRFNAMALRLLATLVVWGVIFVLGLIQLVSIDTIVIQHVVAPMPPMFPWSIPANDLLMFRFENGFWSAVTILGFVGLRFSYAFLLNYLRIDDNLNRLNRQIARLESRKNPR